MKRRADHRERRLPFPIEWPRLQDYLDERIVTGTAAFSIEASGFPDFEEAMRAKLLREISGPGLS